MKTLACQQQKLLKTSEMSDFYVNYIAIFKDFLAIITNDMYWTLMEGNLHLLNNKLVRALFQFIRFIFFLGLDVRHSSFDASLLEIS